MKYYTLLGIIFFAVAFFSMFFNRRRNTMKIALLELEKKELKAAMFDLKKKTDAPPLIKEDTDRPEQEE